MVGRAVRSGLFYAPLVLLLLAAPGWSAVNARLSNEFIDELESVRLIIRATGTRQTETLDLSALEDDFHVMGTNSSSRYQYINGQEESWVDYQITLQPKRTGKLTIPRIAVGSEMTNPLTLNVEPIAAELREKISELVFFESELSATEAYVQSQIIVTRRLLYSNGVQLYSEIPGAPEIPNAVVLVLGETKSGQTTRDGKRYGSVEQRYAIFPEASGELTIPGVSITASVRLVDAGRVTRKGVRVGTDALSARILPVPASYPQDEPWLPAEAVTIEETWNPLLRTAVAVGDTLERELVVRIFGNTGSIAPPLKLALADTEFRQYPQAPTIEDDTRGDTVVGVRTETISVVPQVPGTLNVPVESVTWWDTIANELRVTALDATMISATGDALVREERRARDPITANQDRKEVDTEASSTSIEVPWFWILFAILAVALIAGLVRFRPRLSIPHFGRRPSASRHKHAINAALRKRDARAMKEAVDAYREASGREATQLINLINRYLYRDHVENVISAEDATIAQALVDDLFDEATRRRNTGELPPLYST